MSWFRPRSSLQGTSIPRIGVNIPMPPGMKPPRESWETLADRIQRAKAVLADAPDWLDWSDGDTLTREVSEKLMTAKERALLILMETKEL